MCPNPSNQSINQSINQTKIIVFLALALIASPTQAIGDDIGECTKGEDGTCADLSNVAAAGSALMQTRRLLGSIALEEAVKVNETDMEGSEADQNTTPFWKSSWEKCVERAKEGITPDDKSEASLLELAYMANSVYALHNWSKIEDAPISFGHDYHHLTAAGWSVDWEMRQPPYDFEFPEHLAMAVYTKGKLAVLVFKGTSWDSASDLHLDVLSIVLGKEPCGPLIEGAKLVRGYQKKGYKVMITGHSLGGYMSEVLATNLGLSGVGFCAPGSGSHGGMAHASFQNVNFYRDKAGNILPGIYQHQQWSVYVEDYGNKFMHGISFMVDSMKARPGWTNLNAVSKCESHRTGYYTFLEEVAHEHQPVLD